MIFLCLSALAADPIVHDDGTVRFEGAELSVGDPWRTFASPYLQARGADLSSLSEDGAQMIVSTRFADTSQMHLVSHPGGDRHQLTFAAEPSRGGFVPGSTDLVFTRDRGGDENFQLWRMPLSGGSATLLTDGKSRTEGGSFSEDGSVLLFSSNARNGRDMDIWVSDGKTASSARLLVEVDGDYTPGPFCSDNTRALLYHETSALQAEW